MFCYIAKRPVQDTFESEIEIGKTRGEHTDSDPRAVNQSFATNNPSKLGFIQKVVRSLTSLAQKMAHGGAGEDRDRMKCM
jgi:hypothetical protein